MIEVFDPHKVPSGLIAKDQFEETLHALFKGQFKYREIQNEDGEEQVDTQKGMSEDIKRDMTEKGMVTNKGELDLQKFREALESRLIDINIFK